MLKQSTLKIILIIAVIVLISSLNIAVMYAEYNKPVKEAKIITVDQKFIKLNPNTNKQEYLVADTENNIYKDVDDSHAHKFNSSNVYVALKKGHKYIINTVGIRDPINSEYPNIISIKEVH